MPKRTSTVMTFSTLINTFFHALLNENHVKEAKNEECIIPFVLTWFGCYHTVQHVRNLYMIYSVLNKGRPNGKGCIL